MSICAATFQDIPAILDIERASFQFPWEEETFITTLQDDRCISFLAIEDGKIIGYCLALILESMVHILNLAVHPAFRRKGIARRLIRGILKDQSVKNKMYAALEVRKSNGPARALYSSLGFFHVHTWHRYYTDTNEDAVVMVKDLRKMVAKDVECTIVKNSEVALQTYHIVLEGELGPSEPGQFAMVRVSSQDEPFLRRPLAILGQQKMSIEMLYRINGAGTLKLSQKRQGEVIKVLGPLGRGFKKQDAGNIIYLAGGTGLPPILSLAEHIKAGQFIVGAKTQQDIPLLDRIRAIPNTETIIMTEDGSLGGRGLATDALEHIASFVMNNEDTIVYACGPKGMLQEACRIAGASGFRCEVSLEERMSCGFGACSGCVVKTVHGTMRVCREGPVFNACEIIWS